MEVPSCPSVLLVIILACLGFKELNDCVHISISIPPKNEDWRVHLPFDAETTQHTFERNQRMMIP